MLPVPTHPLEPPLSDYEFKWLDYEFFQFLNFIFKKTSWKKQNEHDGKPEETAPFDVFSNFMEALEKYYGH